MIMYLKYDTNYELYHNQIKRIYPDFEPEGVLYVAPDNQVWQSSEFMAFGPEPDLIPALTPGELIKFVQLVNNILAPIDSEIVLHKLVFYHKIFLSSENFESGALWLIRELNKIN